MKKKPNHLPPSTYNLQHTSQHLLPTTYHQSTINYHPPEFQYCLFVQLAMEPILAGVKTSK